MSKVIPIALAAHYATPWHTVASFVKVERTDATVAGFTTHSHPLTIDGVRYEPGLDISDLVSTDALTVDNLELTFLPTDVTVTADDLRSGRWNKAKFSIFEANYRNVAAGVNPLKTGNTGEVQQRLGKFVLEFLSKTASLQQTQGIVTTRLCRARLGDAKCTIDLAPFTYTGAFTAVADERSFTDSGRGEADDWFGEGIIQITSGDNMGFRQKVRDFAAGAFTTSIKFPNLPVIGDTYTAIAGCRKRHERTLANPDGVSDCRDKYGNVVNFQGEPHMGGLNAAMRPGGAVAQPASTPPLPTSEAAGAGSPP